MDSQGVKYDSIENPGREFFMHLVEVALADNLLVGDEQAALDEIGRNIGFSQAEITAMIEKMSPDGSYSFPDNDRKRMEQLYYMVSVAFADGRLNEPELALLQEFAVKSGFKKDRIPGLLVFLIKGIKSSKSFDYLFLNYEKRSF